MDARARNGGGADRVYEGGFARGAVMRQRGARASLNAHIASSAPVRAAVVRAIASATTAAREPIVEMETAHG
jgi:hypothetical protein